MKNTIQRTVGLLGVVLMATQVIGATKTDDIRMKGSSSAFEQATPVTAAQKEVDRLLRQIASNAAIAGRHAETLETYTRGSPQLQRETHAAELLRIKEAINAMGSDFQQLRALRQ